MYCPILLCVDFLQHSRYHKVLNNIIFCNLGKDRCKGDRVKVLIVVWDRSLCGDRDDNYLPLSKITADGSNFLFLALHV